MKGRAPKTRARLALLALLPAIAAIAAIACGRKPPVGTSIGDVRRGRALAREYGCQTCHVIPGVPGANGTVGPPLDNFARRAYAGGRLNTPAHLIRFIVDPRSVDEKTPMPNVGVSEGDARDIAAFLYSLE